MHPPSSLDTEVLIVGAGPTGLVLALWLTRLGVRVRVIDKTAEAGTTSRAVAVQARTLELYGQIGLADEVIERGRRVAAANLWVAGQQVARAVFGDMGVGISPFPYALVFPQDERERSCARALAAGRRRTGNVRGRLPGGLRRRTFRCTRGAQHRLSRRHVYPPVLRRRRRSERNGSKRRGARCFRPDRFSRRVPVEGRGARSTRWHRTRGRRAPARGSVMVRR